MNHEAPLMAGKKGFRVGEWWGLVSKFVTNPSLVRFYVVHLNLNIQYFIQMCGSL